ncbi:hypothetical protein [Nisaea denitrificans]|uniref:hypothetical protein n=1 Tax=Nisaea denitrificans TaxID=390877 RepID=UPI0004148AE1|nr:hypothetical protein [Nisaea denitrificans]
MTAQSSDIDRLLAHFAADPELFAVCRAEIRGKHGDEAILAVMNFASRHGYEITFQQASETRRQAVNSITKVLRAAVADATDGEGDLKGFLKQW